MAISTDITGQVLVYVTQVLKAGTVRIEQRLDFNDSYRVFWTKDGISVSENVNVRLMCGSGAVVETERVIGSLREKMARAEHDLWLMKAQQNYQPYKLEDSLPQEVTPAVMLPDPVPVKTWSPDWGFYFMMAMIFLSFIIFILTKS